MPVGPLLSLRGSEALVFQTLAGLLLLVWRAVPGSRRLRKRCAPDDGSLGIPGDRVRLPAQLRDTEPKGPHRGVAFWRVTRLGRYIPHTTRGRLPLLEYQGSRGGDLITYRCVACGVTVTRRWDELILPQEDCTGTSEQRGQVLGEYVRPLLTPPEHMDGTWRRTCTLADQRVLQEVFARATPAEWLARDLERLRQASEGTPSSWSAPAL